LFVWVILLPRGHAAAVWLADSEAGHGEGWTGRSLAWEKFGDARSARIEHWHAMKTLLAKSEL
jgi:hypothetical protein